ncbi:DHBP synthase RibB-like alpha/beta domain-containing protein [Apiosordaria backusii]|uniref:Threonylcarbamoyl-AMP synthase n=1 Tax=Apiosordaria backusii TaxID=314023 RepID=A0AA40B7B7_9PEZI|nr:DHBP synthase RibB-like alpha/beta domain-containing protein [Apiosordaria backusii]
MSKTTPPTPPPPKMIKTRILKVPPSTPLGSWSEPGNSLTTWTLPPTTSIPSSLTLAATALTTSTASSFTTPVAFPTETVYGLGADATSSAAVKGIYAAKGRPSDNPLIVHVCDLSMLQSYCNPLPDIYQELIANFWPGPLTILLPVPTSGQKLLAPEVTAGLQTFGVRMPDSALARTLIKLVGKPLAAPSANASTRPSPTKAVHVLEDLEGRIELILDGGDCAVGVESTVVDGLCDPPVVLRPGGVGIEEIRRVKGWEGVVKGYKDKSEVGEGDRPRAPGMKYKHYSPRARVVLFEGHKTVEVGEEIKGQEGGKKVGIIRTGRWESLVGEEERVDSDEGEEGGFTVRQGAVRDKEGKEVATVLDVDLGQDVKGVAHGLFAALRELDRLEADVIFVEGVSDGDDIAAAVMNRLRKAASEIRV